MKSSRSLKFRYYFFVASIVITIGVSLIIILYSLDQQNEDAKLINLAGRQRMLSQRISKLTLFLYYSTESEVLGKTYNFDSLRIHLDSWKKMHYYLIEQNNTQRNSPSIAQLLNDNSPRLEKIYSACQLAVQDPSRSNLKYAIDQIATMERPFLLTMEKTVKTYQKEAEAKLGRAKKIVSGLCLLILTIFIFEFIFVFYPALFGLSESNQKLLQLNKKLSEANSELMATEEEIRTNIEQIHELKDHLELSERQFRELVNDATDMIYELSANGKFSFANPVMEMVTGFSKSELQEMLYPDVVHADDREKVIRFYKDQMERREAVSYLEFRITTKIGKTIWVGQNAKMFFNDNWVYKVSVVARDITKIKEIETQLIRERSLLRTIIDNIPANVYVKDLHSRKILANQAELHHMGATSEKDIIGKSDWELYPETSALVSITEDKQVFSGTPIINLETHNILPDGTEKWFLISKIPLWDENTHIVGLVGISIDITESKRDKELLRFAKDQAEEATLAKSRFLGMMSHEIRTPLNGIMGITGLLNDNHPRVDQIENLKLLKFSCDNLLTIINDILDFNKIEAGKMELENIPFNLAEVATQYHKMLNVKASQKGIRLQLNIDSHLPKYLAGDPVRVGQVLNNLIGNAIKFTEKGGVEVSISEVSRVDKSHRIRFVVSDSGIGISSDKIDSIFSGFTQASNDTTRKFGGTGLGLSITKRLLELMGAQVNVKSELGKGSEFSFEITMLEAEPLISVPSNRVSDTPAAGLTILVVDDNRVNQIVASNFLSKWGHIVTTVNSGSDALSLVVPGKFDIILMDLQMPEMDGYQTTIEIRSKEGDYFKHLPIIALSADVLAEVKDKVLQAGMNDYLSKPFQSSDLQAIIAKYGGKNSFAKNTNSKLRIEEITQGDATYTRELVKHVASNLKELRNAFHETWKTHNPEPFEKAHHKSKTAIFILEQENLTNAIHKVKNRILLRDFADDDLKNEVDSAISEVIQELS